MLDVGWNANLASTIPLRGAMDRNPYQASIKATSHRMGRPRCQQSAVVGFGPVAFTTRCCRRPLGRVVGTRHGSVTCGRCWALRTISGARLRFSCLECRHSFLMICVIIKLIFAIAGFGTGPVIGLLVLLGIRSMSILGCCLLPLSTLVRSIVC